MSDRSQKEKLEEMRRFYEDEQWSLAQIAAHFGITKPAVRERLVKAGVQRRKRGAPKKSFDKEILIKQHVAENRTIHQTAACLGTGYESVRRELKRQGIETPAPNALRRTMPELADLALGATMLIERPIAKNPLIKIHMKAKRFGVKFALKSIHSKIKIKRIG